MTGEDAIDKIVTKFLFSTCRICPWPSEHGIEAAMACAQIAMWPSEDDEYVEHIPLVSGSVAEFYIEPMLTHVHDVDVMFHSTNFLAIPRGHPPPTQLPNEFHSYVKVGEITDSHLPGYVYLPLRYLLTKFTDSDRYNDIQYEEQEQYLVGKFHLSNIKDHVSERHGPGTQQKQPALLPIDVVPCIRCVRICSLSEF